jgi:hydrogenase maturation protein HypF
MRLDQAGLMDVADALFPDHPRDLVRQAAKAGVNAPPSSSVGRLFDGMAACLGLVADRQSYEGEAAMRLEVLAGGAAEGDDSPYPFARSGGVINPAPMFREWAEDRARGVPKAAMAARFQSGLARAFCAAARDEIEAGRAKAVVLSGGCFQNAALLERCMRELNGLRVHIHRQIPANDGGLALGQALIAAARGMPEK